MSTRGIKFHFSVGELVLCFEPDPTKARVLYDAKVLDCQVTKDKHGRRLAAYHIHFQGWNSSWDRIVGENYILKNTEENRTLMKRLADATKKYRKNSQRRRKIDEILSVSFSGTVPALDSDSENSDNSGDDDEDEEDGDDDGRSSSDESSNDTASETRERRRATHTPVDIEIPDILKSRLEDDYIAMNHGDKVTKLPASPNVVEVLEGFMKTFCVNLLCEPSEKEKESRRNNNNNGQEHTLLCPPATSITLCKEFVDGLRICFDYTFPVILLYSVEREQYEHVISTIKPPEIKKEEKPTGTNMSAEEPSAKKQKVAHSKQTDDSENVEHSPRRVTRRSVNLDEGPSSPPVPSKHERKRGSRGRGRGRASGSSHVIKHEPLSDSDMGGSDSAPPAAVPITPNLPGSVTGSKDGASDHCFRKEDILESVLSWQLLPLEARAAYSITPSQIYGVNHFLRLFVKLPEIWNNMDMEDCKMRSLMKLVHHLLRYLVERQEDLFGDIEYVDS